MILLKKEKGMKNLTSDGGNFDGWMSEMMRPSSEELLSAAKTLKETYDSFKKVGFSDKEAFELIKQVLTLGTKGGKL